MPRIRNMIHCLLLAGIVLSIGCPIIQEAGPQRVPGDREPVGVLNILDDMVQNSEWYPVENSRGIWKSGAVVTVADANISFRLPSSQWKGPMNPRPNESRPVIRFRKDGPDNHPYPQELFIFIEAMPGEIDSLSYAILRLADVDFPRIESVFTPRSSPLALPRSVGYRCRYNDGSQDYEVYIVFATHRGTAMMILFEGMDPGNGSVLNVYHALVRSLAHTDADAHCLALFEDLRAQARRGIIPAQIQLGRMFLQGACVGEDYPRALYWYEIAAHSGSSEAMYRLGLMHRDALGTPKNTPLADKLFNRAAARGHGPAMHLLAEKLLADPGSSPTGEQAIDLLNRSVQAGCTNAMLTLAARYASGKIVPKSDANALQLFARAAHRGNGQAQFHLGQWIASGRATKLNRPLAHAWYMIAAANGVPVAQEARQALEKNMTGRELETAQVRLKTMLVNREEGLIDMGWSPFPSDYGF